MGSAVGAIGWMRAAAVALGVLALPLGATGQQAVPQAGQQAGQQAGVWLQVEAQPSLDQARRSAADYARRLDDVAGFRLGSTQWHAITLGPYAEAEAVRLARALRRSGAVPDDAFVTDGGGYRARFWPPSAAGVAAVPAPDATMTPQNPPRAALAATPAPVDETSAEAARSERDLTPEARRGLQIALRWDGVYDGAIDGAFGPGTRAAMADWQAARGRPVTGVLTTGQRAEAHAAHDAPLDGLGMRPVVDRAAGISVALPSSRVAFGHLAPPFAHYDSVAPGDPTRVLLISQRGDRDTLHGLFDVMQTLEIVPDRGFREKAPTAFVLVGEGHDIVSHTEASLADGAVKGFTLIWPTGDERRRLRVLDEMRGSFAALPGAVLPDDAGDGADQGIDLLAGLEIRQPKVVRSGFYVTPAGDVLTTADAVAGCSRITLDADTTATVRAVDSAAGLALLTPERALAPRAVAALSSRMPRLRSAVMLAGYAFDGALGAPSLTAGTLADVRGLTGEAGVQRYEIDARSGDAGGPVLDAAGAVLAMLLPAGPGSDLEAVTGYGPGSGLVAGPGFGPVLGVDGARTLPDGVAFAADAAAIADFLAAEGFAADSAPPAAPLPRDEIDRLARDLTVLVKCWP